MSASGPRPSTADHEAAGESLFDKRRAVLISKIAEHMESLITGMNGLNRNLEAVISVGKEFQSVSTLWRCFHDVVSEDATAQEKQESH
ncbi:DASH complex subunit Dad1-domain-containing protein [Protomyces lactucae-debilis]|uniref:DASH complex subunit DAD1 n=1 Tax=Protomyces lactucae-debilis TaxID=2754530 RepID=A0A1Y2FSV2_PROLT|nr:DASH complex subunit Dad1-domain-containing protein [Protomyces lactucae-debilis]ORY87081.1 DASH complex subunit Dad1-domain-containing protein [Protomyces lactucae-debilis]